MTTATGEYGYDFKAQSAAASWSDSNFTLVSTKGGRIYDNGSEKVLRCVAAEVGAGIVLYKYTGGTYDGGDVTAKIEIIACNSGGDDAVAGIFDENGDGYYLRVFGNSLIVRYSTDHGENFVDSVGTGSITFVAGKIATLTVTKGSPNSVAVTYDGSPVTLSGSTHSATLGTLKACVGVDPNNSGAAEIGSFAVDGLETLAPLIMRWTR